MTTFYWIFYWILAIYSVTWFLPGLYIGISEILHANNPGGSKKTRVHDWQDFIFVPLTILLLAAILGPFFGRLIQALKSFVSQTTFGSGE